MVGNEVRNTVVTLIAVTVVAGAAVWLVAGDPASVQTDPVPATEDLYDPVEAGEAVPVGYRQLLPRDAIFPVYNPSFLSASETDWPNDALIVGVELDGEAKAYPVSFLNRREMVNDWIAGSPVLVTW